MTINNFLAVLYADIFDYPLTKEEMEKWEISGEWGMKRREWEQKITEQNGFYFLKGREKLVKLRQQRQKYSEEKIKIAEKIINLLKIIPTVKLIGLTGNVAVKNAGKSDDIDVLIICSTNSLWLTRFLTTLLVELTGRRRHRQEKKIKNSICLNMFLDENYLTLAKDERNLYTAHEVVQLVPLWEKDDVYLKFLNENQWVKDYLPKVIVHKVTEKITEKHKTCLHNLWVIPEWVLKNFQLWYMRKHLTREKIKEGMIMFHPNDKTKIILDEYNKRVIKYN